MARFWWDCGPQSSVTEPPSPACAVELPAHRAVIPRDLDHPIGVRTDQGAVQALLRGGILDHRLAQGHEIPGVEGIPRFFPP
jgi:hypothetical protein